MAHLQRSKVTLECRSSPCHAFLLLLETKSLIGLELHQVGSREPVHEFPGIHLEAPTFYLPISGSIHCAATPSFDLVCRPVFCQFNTQSRVI